MEPPRKNPLYKELEMRAGAGIRAGAGEGDGNENEKPEDSTVYTVLCTLQSLLSRVNMLLIHFTIYTCTL
jgi:hypothetical protein